MSTRNEGHTTTRQQFDDYDDNDITQEDTEGDVTEEESAALKEALEEVADKDEPEEGKKKVEAKDDDEPEVADDEPEVEAKDDDEPKAKEEPKEIDPGPPEVGVDDPRRAAMEALDERAKKLIALTPEQIESYYKAKRKELNQKFEDGDLSQTEYMDEREQLAEMKIRNLMERKSIEDRIEQQVRSASNSHEAAFDSAIQAFLADDPANQKLVNNTMLRQMFQHHIEDVAQSETALGKSWRWVLENAKRAVMADAAGMAELVGMKPGEKPKTQADKKAELENERKKQQAEERKKVPQTLSNIPPADDDGDGKSKYDILDDLPIEDLERELSKMPEHEQERYLRAS